MEIKSERTVTNQLQTLGSQKYTLNPDAMGHIARLLRNMYKLPVLAVFREYWANAIDAHIEAGHIHPDSPAVRIQLPDLTRLSDPNGLILRDRGRGLDRQAANDYLFSFGGSAKRINNIAIGGFGVGCKCAYAISDAFSYVVWHGGYRREWLCSLDEQDNCDAKLLSEELSDDPTGVEVRITIPDALVEDMRGVALLLLALYDGPVNMDLGDDSESRLDTVTLHEGDKWSVLALDEDDLLNSPTATQLLKTQRLISMGGIPYPLELDLDESTCPAGFDTEYWSRVGAATELLNPLSLVILQRAIGSYPLAPDREGLQYTTKVRGQLEEEVKAMTVTGVFRGILDTLLSLSAPEDRADVVSRETRRYSRSIAKGDLEKIKAEFPTLSGTEYSSESGIKVSLVCHSVEDRRIDSSLSVEVLRPAIRYDTSGPFRKCRGHYAGQYTPVEWKGEIYPLSPHSLCGGQTLVTYERSGCRGLEEERLRASLASKPPSHVPRPLLSCPRLIPGTETEGPLFTSALPSIVMVVPDYKPETRNSAKAQTLAALAEWMNCIPGLHRVGVYLGPILLVAGTQTDVNEWFSRNEWLTPRVINLTWTAPAPRKKSSVTRKSSGGSSSPRRPCGAIYYLGDPQRDGFFSPEREEDKPVCWMRTVRGLPAGGLAEITRGESADILPENDMSGKGTELTLQWIARILQTAGTIDNTTRWIAGVKAGEDEPNLPSLHKFFGTWLADYYSKVGYLSAWLLDRTLLDRTEYQLWQDSGLVYWGNVKPCGSKTSPKDFSPHVLWLVEGLLRHPGGFPGFFSQLKAGPTRVLLRNLGEELPKLYEVERTTLVARALTNYSCDRRHSYVSQDQVWAEKIISNRTCRSPTLGAEHQKRCGAAFKLLEEYVKGPLGNMRLLPTQEPWLAPSFNGEPDRASALVDYINMEEARVRRVK